MKAGFLVPLLLIVGLACLAVGIYLIVYQNNQSSATPNSSNSSIVQSSSSSSITIPLNSYSAAEWDEYGVGTDNPSNPLNVYMRSSGYVAYPFTVSNVAGGNASVSVKLSSELGLKLEGTVNGNPQYSSDVTLYINDREQATQNIMADDKVGRLYTWTVPTSSFKENQSNSLTFRIKKTAQHRNGITIHSPITIQFQEATPPPSKEAKQRIKIPATVMWVDTGMDITGKHVHIQYESGQWSNSNGSGNIFNDGWGSGSWPGVIVPNAPFRSLVGKVGSTTFLVGNEYDGRPGNGTLYLSMNDKEGFYDDNVGALYVQVTLK